MEANLNSILKLLTFKMSGSSALDLKRNSKYLKDIKHGLFKSVEDLEKWFEEKKKVLDTLYETSKIPKKTNDIPIGNLLNQCIEEFHGRR